MSWRPSNDLEEEIVALQPDHNFIYGQLTDEAAHVPRPKTHLEYADSKFENKKIIDSSAQSQKLKIIGKIQAIAGTKPLGELPELADWDNDEREKAERETIRMIRNCGLGPSVDQSLIPPRIEQTKEYIINYNGKKSMPVLLSSKYFELRPKCPQYSSSESSPTVSTSLDDSSTTADSEQPSTTIETIDSETCSTSASGGDVDPVTGLWKLTKPRIKWDPPKNPWKYIKEVEKRETNSQSEEYLVQRCNPQIFTAKELYQKKRVKHKKPSQNSNAS